MPYLLHLLITIPPAVLLILIGITRFYVAITNSNYYAAIQNASFFNTVFKKDSSTGMRFFRRHMCYAVVYCSAGLILLLTLFIY